MCFSVTHSAGQSFLPTQRLAGSSLLPAAAPHPCPQAFAQGNIIHEDLLNAFERELSASWVELDSAGRETRRNRLDDFTSQVWGYGGGKRRVGANVGCWPSTVARRHESCLQCLAAKSVCRH